MQPVPRSFQAHRPVLDEAWPAQPPGSPRYDPKQNFRLPLELEILTNRRCARSPLTKIAGNRLLGKRPVIARAGTNDPMIPEISEPSRINGTPPNINARKENQKFCQLKANHLITRKNSID